MDRDIALHERMFSKHSILCTYVVKRVFCKWQIEICYKTFCETTFSVPDLTRSKKNMTEFQM